MLLLMKYRLTPIPLMLAYHRDQYGLPFFPTSSQQLVDHNISVDLK